MEVLELERNVYVFSDTRIFSKNIDRDDILHQHIESILVVICTIVHSRDGEQKHS